jgi:hypothetical protein
VDEGVSGRADAEEVDTGGGGTVGLTSYEMQPATTARTEQKKTPRPRKDPRAYPGYAPE